MHRVICLHGHEIELLQQQLGQRIACPICQLLMVVSPPRPGEPMIPKYEVLCENGHILRVKSKYIGTSIRCPQCQALATVTTDRLQKNTSTATTEPLVPALLPQPSARREIPSTIATPIITAAALVDIPIAEVDNSYTSPPTAPLDDDDEEVSRDDTALTKAERRNLSLVDQGLGYYLFGMIGLFGIVMAAVVILDFVMLISLGISTADGARAMGNVGEVIGWIIRVAVLLCILLVVAGQVLTVFTPWITGATIWFILSLIITVGLIGYRVFVMITGSGFGSGMSSLMGSLGEDKVLYYLHQALVLVAWLLVLLGLWQLAKFARKPLTRQKVMLLGMLGVGLAIASQIVQLLIYNYPPTSKAAVWVVVIALTLATLGVGTLMIYQHLNVINEVRTIMFSRKRK